MADWEHPDRPSAHVWYSTPFFCPPHLEFSVVHPPFATPRPPPHPTDPPPEDGVELTLVICPRHNWIDQFEPPQRHTDTMSPIAPGFGCRATSYTVLFLLQTQPDHSKICQAFSAPSLHFRLFQGVFHNGTFSKGFFPLRLEYFCGHSFHLIALLRQFKAEHPLRNSPTVHPGGLPLFIFPSQAPRSIWDARFEREPALWFSGYSGHPEHLCSQLHRPQSLSR